MRITAAGPKDLREMRFVDIVFAFTSGYSTRQPIEPAAKSALFLLNVQLEIERADGRLRKSQMGIVT